MVVLHVACATFKKEGRTSEGKDSIKRSIPAFVPLKCFWSFLWCGSRSRREDNRVEFQLTCIFFFSLVYVAWVHFRTHWTSWCPNWQCLLGALLPGAWHPTWWHYAIRQSSWRRLFQYLFHRDRCWKACTPSNLCGFGTFCNWWGPHWNLPSIVPSWAADVWQGGCGQQLCTRTLHHWKGDRWPGFGQN